MSDKARKFTRRDFLRIGGLTAGGASARRLRGPAAAPQVVKETVVVETEKIVEQTVEVAKEVTVKETVVVSQEQAVLTVAHAWEAAFMDVQIKYDAAFMERHPDIFIKQINSGWADHNQTVPTWAAAGELPDIIYVHGSRAFPWNYEGIMMSNQDYIDNDPEFNVEDVWEEARRLYALNGKQYEIPYDHGPMIMGYNKDIFDAAGEPYPTADWTMDDFLAKAKKLTKDPIWGYSGYYGGVVGLGNELGIALVGPWGGEVFSEDESKLLVDSAEAKAGLQFFADLIHKDKVAPAPDVSNSFPAGIWIAGVAAMFGLATWGVPQMVTFGDFNWDVAPWPKGPQGPGHRFLRFRLRHHPRQQVPGSMLDLPPRVPLERGHGVHVGRIGPRQPGAQVCLPELPGFGDRPRACPVFPGCPGSVCDHRPSVSNAGRRRDLGYLEPQHGPHQYRRRHRG